MVGYGGGFMDGAADAMAGQVSDHGIACTPHLALHGSADVIGAGTDAHLAQSDCEGPPGTVGETLCGTGSGTDGDRFARICHVAAALHRDIELQKVTLLQLAISGD